MSEKHYNFPEGGKASDKPFGLVVGFIYTIK